MMISWEMVSCVALRNCPKEAGSEVGPECDFGEGVRQPGTNHRRRLLLVVRNGHLT